MEETISARYEWNPDALVDALAVHRRHSTTLLARLGLGLVLAFYFLATIGIPLVIAIRPENPPHMKRNGFIALLVFGSIWYLLYQAVRKKTFQKKAARRAFGANPGLTSLVEWSADENQISNRTTLSSSTFLWPIFIKALEAPEGFLLYQNRTFFHFIPAHAFDSEGSLRQFADLARTKVPNYVVLGECRFPAKPEPIGLDEL